MGSFWGIRYEQCIYSIRLIGIRSSRWRWREREGQQHVNVISPGTCYKVGTFFCLDPVLCFPDSCKLSAFLFYPCWCWCWIRVLIGRAGAGARAGCWRVCACATGVCLGRAGAGAGAGARDEMKSCHARDDLMSCQGRYPLIL